MFSGCARAAARTGLSSKSEASRPRDPATITLRARRRIDNWYEGLTDDSARARFLHHLRRKALRKALRDSPCWDVVNWGKTDGAEASTTVELVLAIRPQATYRPSDRPALSYLDELLRHRGVERVVREAIDCLIRRLAPRQRRELLDVEIGLGEEGTVRCDPDGERLLLTLQDHHGGFRSVLYGATDEDVESLRRFGSPSGLNPSP